MSNRRPPSSSHSPERRPSSGRAYDAYSDREYRPTTRNSAPSGRSSSSSYHDNPTYRSSPPRSGDPRGGDPRYSSATRPPSSSRPSSSRPSGSRPSSSSNSQRSGRPSNHRKKRKRSPFALLLPVIVLLALVALLVVGLKACVFNGAGKDAGNYSLEFSAQTMAVGGTATVKVVGLPENFDGTITWSSSDNEIVRVNDGNLTAKKVGTVTISASVNGKNVPGTVKVVETVEGIRSVTITPSSVSILSGKTYQLQYKLEFDQDNAPAVNPTWSSSNPSVASVSKEGLVTARDVGSASITATVGNQSATCIITVEKDPNSQPAESTEGAEEGTPDANAGGTETTPPANTGTNNTNTGSNTGTTKPGNNSTTNNAGSGNTAGTKPSVTSLALSQKDGFLDVGQTLVLEAYVAPAGSTVKWTSSNGNVASVAPGGLVTAKAAGTAVITVSAGGFSQSCKLIVSAPSAEPSPEETPAQ